MSGTLYLVSTPIGNLADISYRAVHVLNRVEKILVEDTRVTKKLLAKYEIDTPMTSYHEHNKLETIPKVLKILKTGSVALVSDAGTPVISDPGYELVQAAIKHNIKITTIPGPTALISGLIASGLPPDKFAFMGFLPKKSQHIKSLLLPVKDLSLTLIFYDSPHRLRRNLETIHTILGDRQICIARELTKRFESYQRLSLSQAIEYEQLDQIAGEVVLLVAGASKNVTRWSQEDLFNSFEAKQSNISLSQFSKDLAEISGWNKKEIYQLYLDYQNEN